MSSIESLFAQYGPAYRWLATATVMVSAISVVLSSTIVNVAVPEVMGAFGIGQVEAQWLSTGFLAAMTSTMLLTDWVTKSFGLRAGMTGALLVFLLGSLIGGTAQNETMLTIARVIQGASAGLVQPLAMVLLFQVYPPEKRGSAMGIYGIGVVLAPALGPWIGGMLIDSFSWRYVLYLGIPFAGIAIVLSNLFMPTRDPAVSRPSFDWLGLALVCIFVGTLLNALTSAQRLGWDADIIVLQFTASLISAIVFLFWERRCSKPMLDLRLFAELPFASASLVGFVLGAGMYGSTYLVPLFVQTIQGLPPIQAGLLLMPSGFVLVFIFPIAGRLADRFPAGILIGVGLTIFAYSSYLTAFAGIETTFWTLVWWTVLSRIGLGLIFPSLSVGALKVLPPELVGQGSGTMNFIRQIGAAFGVNFLSIFLERRTVLHADALTASQTSDNPATMVFINHLGGIMKIAGLPDFQQTPAAILFLGQSISLQANTLAFQDSFLAVTMIFVFALGPTWIMYRAQRK